MTPVARSDLLSGLALDRDRLSRTLFIALSCGVVVLVSKSLSLPETALSAYLVFFATRQDGTTTAATAFALCIVAPLAIGLTIVLIMATAGAPPLRIAAMFGVTFLAMYAARATAAGVVAATIAMAMFEVLSVLDYLAYPGLLLRALFWLLTVVFMPMGVLLIASLIFGRDALSCLHGALTDRLRAIRQAVIARSPESRDACRSLVLNSQAEAMAGWRRLAQATGRINAAGADKAAALEAATDRLLIDCAAGRMPENTAATRAALDLDQNARPDDARLVALLADTAAHEHTTARSEDSSHQESMRFALKATFAIAICYAIFTLLQWPAIHTITITAFLVCLGSTAETMHKSALRILGCLFGAVLSFGALILVVPNINGIGGLAVLTVLALLPAAWIATGPERMSYAGMQIALVFLLSVVNTSGPDVDLGVTWGRIVGIVLGNLVVAAVFLTVWPVSIRQTIEANLDKMDLALKKRQPGAAAAAFARVREDLDLSRFEPDAGMWRQRLSARATKLEARLFGPLRRDL